MREIVDRCINPVCQGLIRYKEGTQEIKCPWCDHAFLTCEFKGEQEKILAAYMEHKKDREALELTRRERDALQALLNESQQTWIDSAKIQEHIRTQLGSIQSNTEELLDGQKKIIDEVLETRRAGQSDSQQLLEQMARDRQQDAQERARMQYELEKLKEKVSKRPDTVPVYVPQPKSEQKPIQKQSAPIPSGSADAARMAEEYRMEQVYRDAARRAPQGPNGELYTPENEFELGSIGEGYIIRKYIGSRAVVAIPPEIRGRKVVAIGESAFSAFTIFQTKKVVEVIIPTTVTVIETAAFAGCLKLERVEAHQYIERIAFNAFVKCQSMRMIYFGLDERTERVATFPPSLKEIGSQAFLTGFGGVGSFLTEVNLSKKTRLKKQMGYGPFPKKCAIFYYD